MSGKVKWGPMLYELRHNFEPDFPDVAWLNVHPEDMRDFAASSDSVEPFVTDPPTFMGMVIVANQHCQTLWKQ